MTLRVPLIRVEGKSFTVRPDLTMTPERFAAAEPLQREARDQAARDAEAAFGFQPSLYFFAGVAHPSFGDVVLAYHPEASTQLDGGMTTFDTGGMYLGFVRGRGLSTPDERKEYVERDCCALDSWRARASDWIEGNFESVDGYIEPDGRPRCEDPEERMGHPQNERRAWTIEVRLYEDRNVFDQIAFVIVRQEFLQRALHVSQTSKSDNERLLRMLDDGSIVHVGVPDIHPCGVAVEYVRTYIRDAGSETS